MTEYATADALIVGGGIAGITTALELLDRGKRVILLERAPRERLGGLANEAFGGMLFAGTGLQRLNGIHDNKELFRADWFRAAEFGANDEWPKRWADTYIERSTPDVYDWLRARGIHYFPVPQWVERGDFLPLNSVPRYHVVWGTGWHLTQTLINALEKHPRRANLDLRCGHYVEDFLSEQGRIAGVRGYAGANAAADAGSYVKAASKSSEKSVPFTLRAEVTVVAGGGINGNLQRVREAWDNERYGKPPALLLNGAHPDADGHLHDLVSRYDGRVVRLGQMWNYAAGIRHPQPQFAEHGLSLIPPRSALWMDCRGNRVGPVPMMSGFDTHALCGRLGHMEDQYGWLVMNRRIVLREMAISGSHVNTAFCQRNLLRLAQDIFLGNKEQYQLLTQQCPDVVTATTLEELAARMNSVTGNSKVSADNLRASINPYDAQIARGPCYHDDDQLRRIAQLRKWRGDKARTLKFQAINDAAALPLVAIRVMLLSRKSMGGIETDLSSRVLGLRGQVLPGLYAVGEASGFGGGGISGIRSLEGTFLSGCILSARIAARAIAGASNPATGW